MADREPQGEQPTIGKLIVDAFEDVSTLIKHTIELAKSEMKVSVRAGGGAIGLFAAAGFILVLAIIMVSVSIPFFLAMAGLDLAWGFLIVFGAYLLLAVILVAVGVKLIKKVKAPERTLAQAAEIPRALSGH